MAKDKILRSGLSMAREIAEDAAGALANAAPGTRRTLGDMWGFQARPGEISGTEFTNEYNRLWRQIRQGPKPPRAQVWYITNIPDELKSYYPTSTPEYRQAVADLRNLYDRAVPQLKGKSWSRLLKNFPKRGIRSRGIGRDWDATEKLMAKFAWLEEAGVPREITGTMVRNGMYYHGNQSVRTGIWWEPRHGGSRSPLLSLDELKNLTVEEFENVARVLNSTQDVAVARLVANKQLDIEDVGLLRRMRGLKAPSSSPDEYAAAAIKSLSPAQKTVLRRIVESWEGNNLDELVETARLLAGG